MKFNHLMGVTSVITLLLGLSFMFYGRWVMSFYDINYEVPPVPTLGSGNSVQPFLVGIAFVRIFGSLLLGLGLLAWFTRNLSNVEAQRTILLGLFLVNVLAFLAVLLQKIPLGRSLPPLTTQSAWLLATIFLMLSAALGYARFLQSNGS
jgi:hypothetical protein